MTEADTKRQDHLVLRDRIERCIIDNAYGNRCTEAHLQRAIDCADKVMKIIEVSDNEQ